VSLINETYNEKLILKHPKASTIKTFFNVKKSTNPFVFIIGAQKCGTTSLLADLVNHPQILKPIRKEFYFFNNQNIYKKGVDWYLGQFPSSTDKAFNVDATANSFESKEAPSRMKKEFPNSKIILLLRNPTERAYSHYKMAVNLGFEKLSFSDALKMENERLAYSAKNYIKDTNHDYVFQKLGYRVKGVYINFLQNWLKEYSFEDIKIIQSETYFEKPKEIFNEIINHLDLEHFTPNQFNIFKQNSASNISEELKIELDKFYKPYNEKLYKLIGKEFDW
jgi:hypothetical protein